MKFQRSNPGPCQVPKISAYAIKTRTPAEILIISTVVVLCFFQVFFGKIESPNLDPSEVRTSFYSNAKLNQHAKNTFGGVAWISVKKLSHGVKSRPTAWKASPRREKPWNGVIIPWKLGCGIMVAFLGRIYIGTRFVFFKNRLKMICETDPCGSYTVLPLMLWPPAMKVDESHQDQDRVPSRVGNRIWNITHTYMSIMGGPYLFPGCTTFFWESAAQGGEESLRGHFKRVHTHTHLFPIWYHNMASFGCWEYAIIGYKRHLFWPMKNILL